MGGDGDGPPTCHAWLSHGLWLCQAPADSSPGFGERGLGGKSCFSEQPLPGGRVQDPSTPPTYISSPWPGSDDGAHPQEQGAGSLRGLETLETPAAAAGTPPSASSAEVPARLRSGVPESYLSGSQQQWLSLRLHRARRWRVPGLPCVGNSPES